MTFKFPNATLFQYTPEFRKSQLEGILTDCVLVYSKISSSKKTLNVDETCNAINTHLTVQEYLAKMHEESGIKQVCLEPLEHLKL